MQRGVEHRKTFMYHISFVCYTFNTQKMINLHFFSPEEVGILANSPENWKTLTRRIQLVFSQQNRWTRTTAYRAPPAGSAPVDKVSVC